MTGVTLSPAFDIDTFDCAVDLPEKKTNTKAEFTYDFAPWGKLFKPKVETTGITCKAQKCVLDQSTGALVFTKPKGTEGVRYRIVFTQPDNSQSASNTATPCIGRWWIVAGYPFVKSLSVLNNSNPSALFADGQLPLDSMRGYGAIEFGIAPGRWQLPAGIQWALVTQVMFGNGNMPEFTANGSTVSISLLSMGGGIRVDRPFWIGSWYGISPYLGSYAHYQRYFRSFTSTALNVLAIVPEIGLNQYFRFGGGSKWRLLISLAAGGFFYNSQNLSYARASVGVEYAYK